ncbi:NUDIX hydrolase [Actinacidiphila acididurans]|uniref:NUDIX domain-containing protein n=1 Tax=Actinacidiphila acididurans TaxID=2784346 RepID=A0ABS2TVV9_9ACTN|nr:NUDIX hydrolase [Actinacidiphila acididurans]MBM9507479.1 NUDIX domain-containing protein [Actinacidiphila acididurans]
MIIWVNGAFGAGKSRAAREMLDLIPQSTLYDPEVLGAFLRGLLPEKRLPEAADCWEMPLWRRLVVDTAAALLAEVGGALVVPMTLLRQEHRDEVFGGLAARGIDVRHVLLDPGETILRERIAARGDDPEDGDDETARRRAQDRVEEYLAALPWLALDAHVVRTAGLTPRQTALAVTEAVGRGEGVCDIVQTPAPRAETVAAGVLLFDDADRVLLVDPTYKPGWEFPGGVVERGESPTRAGHREVAEELGIELTRGLELLVVDWEPPQPPGHGGLRLIFDGGRMPRADIGRLLLPDAELRDWRFVTEDEAAGLLPQVRLDRLRWALRAREQGRPLNLEAGQPVR